jgi:hypothetical protein
MSRTRPAAFALLWVFLFGTACTSYRQIQLADVVDYDEVQVTTEDGIRRMFIDPSLEPDSLRGYLNEEAVALDETWAVPLDAVSEVKTRQPDNVETAGTVILAGAGILVVAVAVWAMTCADSSMLC